MIDPALVRDHLDQVRAGYRNRGLDADADLEQLATLETRRRRLIPEIEGLKREQNAAGDEVARAKTARPGCDALFAASKARGQQHSPARNPARADRAQRTSLLLTLPNLPHESVPVGRSADDNRGSAASGAAARLRLRAEAALGSRRRARHSGLRARHPHERRALLGAHGHGRAPGARADQLHARRPHARARLHRSRAAVSRQRRGACAARATCRSSSRICSRSRASGILYLIPTAEVPLTNLHRDEILDGRSCRFSYTAYTPCFRSEAGIVRRRRPRSDSTAPVRQGRAREVHDARAVVRRARVADTQRRDDPRAARAAVPDASCCARATWASRSAKTYDIEVWLPSQKTYREISSCSNTEAFQARRANIKFRSGGTGKAELVAHAERLGPRRRTHADRDSRELPAGRRFSRRSGGPAAATWARMS